MDKTVQPLVAAHYAAAQEIYGADNVFATMLYGSQNYELNTPESDVDTKTMIFPSVRDVILGAAPVSIELPLPSGISVIKDARSMFTCLVKSNINFLECLFTPYYVVNPHYQEEWDELMSIRNNIADANPTRLLHAAAGMATQKHHAMTKNFTSKAEILAKHGYDPKQLHHLVRLKYFITDYLEKKCFAECLVPEDRGYLLSLKTNPISLEEAISLGDKTMLEINSLIREIPENLSDTRSVKEPLDDLAYRAICRRFRGLPEFSI